MSQANGPQVGIGGPGGLGGGSGLAVLPPLWVGVNVALAAWGFIEAWPVIYDHDIPDAVLTLIYGGLIAGVVNLLWGLLLVGLAISRSASFPRHFTIWQIVNIVWIAVRETYVLVTPDFAPTIQPLLYGAGEIAIGIFCIAILRRKSETAQAYSNAGAERPPVIVSIIAAILGVIVGSALGFGVGFFGGGLFADATNMSCFEGACGYFAFFMGLFALLAGAIAGGIFAVWRVNRRRPARPA
jgi:hypothetical protein